jgi:hypothetical protein
MIDGKGHLTGRFEGVVCCTCCIVPSLENLQPSKDAQPVKRLIDLRFSSSSGVLFEMWRLGIRKGTFASGYNSDVVNEAYECVIADELFNVSDLHHEDICAYKARRMVASPSLRCEAARRRVVTAELNAKE